MAKYLIGLVVCCSVCDEPDGAPQQMVLAAVDAAADEKTSSSTAAYVCPQCQHRIYIDVETGAEEG